MWIKYKHKFSSGIDREWSWRFISYEDKLDKWAKEELVRNIANEYDGEHYRGIDYTLEKYPTIDVLEKEISTNTRSITRIKKHTKFCDELLKEVKLRSLLM